MLLSMIFFIERTSFIDNPFQIFLMIQDQDIVVMAGRYPSVVVRWLPFWVMKMGGSITAIMFAFSLAYMLFHGFVFYLISYRLHMPAIALAIPAMLTIATVDGFYWCNSELIQSISFSFLTLAIYRSHFGDKLKWLSFLICMILTLFFHPMGIAVLCFLLAFDIDIRNIEWSRLVWIVIALVAYFAKSKLLPNWYDTIKFNELSDNIGNYKSSLLSMPSLQTLFQYYNPSFIIVPLIVLSLVACWYARWYYRFVLIVISIFVFAITIHLGDPLAPYPFYLEVNRTPLLIIAFWPLLYFIISENKKINTNYITTVFTILMVVGFIKLSLRSNFYNDRIEYYLEKTTEYSGDHFYLSSRDVDMDMIQMEWASPYESLVITSRVGESKTLFISKDKPIPTKESPTQFIGTFKNYDPLNNYYFNLDEGNYIDISH